MIILYRENLQKKNQQLILLKLCFFVEFDFEYPISMLLVVYRFGEKKSQLTRPELPSESNAKPTVHVPPVMQGAAVPNWLQIQAKKMLSYVGCHSLPYVGSFSR